jgi:hypothetical protein
MSSIRTKQVADVLDRLFARAETEDPPRFEHRQEAFRQSEQPRDKAGASRLLAEIFEPVDRAEGRLRYLLAQAQGSRRIVEAKKGISPI